MPPAPPPAPLIRWQRAQLASNTFRPAATCWAPAAAGSGGVASGAAGCGATGAAGVGVTGAGAGVGFETAGVGVGVAGTGWTGDGRFTAGSVGPGWVELCFGGVLSTTASGFLPREATTMATAAPTSTRPPRARPSIRGVLLEDFFGRLRRLRRGAGRSSSSSSRSWSASGSGGRSSSAGTGKTVPHFGHRIAFPSGVLVATRRPASHDGQASFLVNTADHLTFRYGRHRPRAL